MPHLGKENGYSMCTASPSLSSVISGVQSFMWNYFKSMFPSRSEEHTSELQSRFDLVCRLLLEKKNADYILPKRIHCHSCCTLRPRSHLHSPFAVFSPSFCVFSFFL